MKKRIICILLSLTMLLAAVSLRISRYYSISCEAFAENGIKGVITRDINNYLSEYINKNKLNYSDIARINYLSEGRIGSISVDTIKINQFANDIASNIYSKIESSKNEFGIPIGNTLGIEYLSGKGPKITFTVIPIGYVAYEIKSELLSGGINQTLHRISIKFDMAIRNIAPFHQSSSSINITVILAETIIIGNVPEIILSPA